ncbi:MAG TPA: hypothetical protein VN228_00690 [Pyrinomonadaceae bacterium]|nr:hypothetical protein [Pyrinomonadaceae bacterium]
MSNTLFKRTQARGAITLLVVAAALLVGARAARAASWKGLEPFVSKRADVERQLGAPASDRMSETGTLQFNVSGGTVTVFFVTPKFIAAKKLSPALEGTVLQIVLQHPSATDTPESLNVVTNSDFERQAKGNTEVFTNAKEGLIYTFIDSRLRTTRYSYSAQQLARIQRGK